MDLPLENNQYSMYIILPTKRNDLDNVIKSMNCETLISEIRSVRAKKVNVFLPKFKLDSDLKLKTTLTTMGMVKAFSKKEATFKGISIQPGLYISDVYHKVTVLFVVKNHHHHHHHHHRHHRRRHFFFFFTNYFIRRILSPLL